MKSNFVQFSSFTREKREAHGSKSTYPGSHSCSGCEARPQCLGINPCLPTGPLVIITLFTRRICTALLGLRGGRKMQEGSDFVGGSSEAQHSDLMNDS